MPQTEPGYSHMGDESPPPLRAPRRRTAALSQGQVAAGGACRPPSPVAPALGGSAANKHCLTVQRSGSVTLLPPTRSQPPGSPAPRRASRLSEDEGERPSPPGAMRARNPHVSLPPGLLGALPFPAGGWIHGCGARPLGEEGAAQQPLGGRGAKLNLDFRGLSGLTGQGVGLAPSPGPAKSRHRLWSTGTKTRVAGLLSHPGAHLSPLPSAPSWPCPSPTSPSPSPPLLICSGFQLFLQALEPEEVTAYLGPAAALEGTCPGIVIAKGVSQRLGHITTGSGGLAPGWLCWEEVRAVAGVVVAPLMNSITSCQVDKTWSGCSGLSWGSDPGVLLSISKEQSLISWASFGLTDFQELLRFLAGAVNIYLFCERRDGRSGPAPAKAFSCHSWAMSVDSSVAPAPFPSRAIGELDPKAGGDGSRAG